ncbi:phosphate-starvation-inducible protein PsiE [Paenibacillus shunpengii]|uniref:Protein PsiE n=1 Tax=Paenibacillus shunpengii TaxID=2054424 RepID=A0ABW5SN62_9BACL|nr:MULTISPECIES: phosphate-starvation-inducible protein PsiE [unclassified Paenibacillus]SDW67364.1 protein PsiE [Paenibacillus sp. PDC88]
MKEAKRESFIAKYLQQLLNVMLLLLAIILSMFLVRKTMVILDSLLIQSEPTSYYYLTEGILVYFLYFEFLSLIVKYFTHNYHFPLRYFIYIGITAIIRLIIINHEDPIDTFTYCLSILVLVITLFIANTRNLDAN